jgi:outer membrane protein W
MKKYQLLLFFTVFCLAASSQIVNLKVGPTFSQMTWENSVASTDTYFNENYVGFYASLGLDYLQKKGFSLNSNIGYLTNGGKGTVNYSDEMGNIVGDTTQTTKLHFFTLNTIAKYNFITEKKISPFLGLGVGLNYLIAYEENVKLLEQFDEIDEMNIMLWGLIGTAGLNFNLNKVRLGMEFMYNYNLNKLIDYEGITGFSNQVSVNYFSVLFSVGYRLK